MIGHLSFGVSDLDRSTAFYDAVMAALGFKRFWTSPNGVGYGLVPNMDGLALLPRADATPPGPGFHLAFDAPDRDSVDAFHAAALAAGGICNGPPGPRPQYGETYYAAFVIDPDGYKLEAVHQ